MQKPSDWRIDPLLAFALTLLVLTCIYAAFEKPKPSDIKSELSAKVTILGGQVTR
jgi:hypothetical protein